MRFTPVRIGILGVSTLLAVTLYAGSVFAETSPSYSLTSDYPNTATQNAGNSTNFAIAEGQQTWNQKPLTSTSYEIVLPGGGYESTSSSSSSSSSGGSSSSTPTGSRGDRAGTTGGAGGTPTASSSSSSSEVSAPPHAAASSEPIVREQPPAVSAPEAPSMEKRTPFGEALSFFAPTECAPVHEAAESFRIDGVLRMAVSFLWILLIFTLLCIGSCAYLTASKTRNAALKAVLKIVGHISCLTVGILIMLSIAGIVHAAQTTPNKHIYNGRLLNSSGIAVTTSTSIRFSYWKSVDFVASDLTGAGAIDTNAVNYAGWQEVHTVTPNSAGYFSVKLGSVNALPDFSTLPAAVLLNLYLQVDVKDAAAADTSYELLDADSTDTAIDRSGVLSVPFAQNADMVDQREIGTGSGNIAILDGNGKLPVSTTPAGTNASSFTLDADNTEISEIAHVFGAALGKKLSYVIATNTFKFNASLEIEGNLVVTGLINGINVTQLQSSTGALKASSGGGLNLNVSNGSYRLKGVITTYNGGSIALPSGLTRSVFFGSGGLTQAADFPADESFIPVAIVTTSIGSIISIQDKRALSSDDREHTKTLTFNPAFEKSSYQGDGADNVGQLSVSHDNITLNNFYLWTTTKSTLQDYDILIRVPVTEHFVRWRTDAEHNPISLAYRSTSASAVDNKLDIQVYDTSGVPVSLSGSVSNLAGTSWTTTQVEFGGTPTWTAGQDMMIKLHVSAKDNYQLHIGSLKLKLVELE